MTAAMKQKDTVRLGALRMLRSAIKYREVELQNDLDDQEVLPLVRTQIKQRKEGPSPSLKKAAEMILPTKNNRNWIC